MRVFVAIVAIQHAAMLSLTERHDVHTRRMVAQSSSWHKGPRVPEDQIIQVKLGLATPQASVAAAEEVLQAVSDPASDTFGQYLSVGDIARIFAPSPEQIRETAKWLNDSGIPRSSLRISAHGDRISFNATVGQAQQLVNTQW
ncbi:hypothetical protein OIDMADRAFT_61516 [Oidiodendron maius Zn]|uniref:Peptidase S53 activation domain-containing protein n=1 Tax=Oidiodendron maius (strain Zn) TaxID=913774 RepID=A0A0C3C3Z9_OIDMZ|nr:hypothetical protein OIDMADRAFT_61516 [Oidiodendron maius Zn]